MGMTNEEKKARKLAKKLSRMRAAINAKKQRKMEELNREMTSYEMHRLELSTRLRTIMFSAKEPANRQIILAMLHTFDRSLDKKDHLINLIVHLRRIGNNQYQRTIASFCEIVDGIIGNFLVNLENMCKETDRKITALLKQGDEERNYMMAYQKNAETHLSILLYHSHELADSLAWTIRGENFVKKDEDINAYLEIYVELRSLLEGAYTVMWQQFKDTLKGYLVGTADNQKQLRILRKKDAMMSDVIASQARKIAASDGIIRRLRMELATYESGTKQAGFRDRRQRHMDACYRLKQCFYEGLDLDEKQLERLVMMSNDTVTYLQTAGQKSEKIMRLATLCRKLETQCEKVLPYGTTIPEVTTNMIKTNKKSKGNQKQTTDSFVRDAIQTSCALTRLWQRISKAELSKKALCREKTLLERENAELMRMLEMRGEEKLSVKTKQCICFPKASKRSIDRPYAVEGCLEAKKIIRY